MIADLQPGEVVVAEKIARISPLPLPDAELLVKTIRSKGARLAVPRIVDLTDLVADSVGVARIMLEAVQDMLLRVALQGARDDYETRANASARGSISPSGQGATPAANLTLLTTAASSRSATPA